MRLLSSVFSTHTQTVQQGNTADLHTLWRSLLGLVNVVDQECGLKAPGRTVQAVLHTLEAVPSLSFTWADSQHMGQEASCA